MEGFKLSLIGIMIAFIFSILITFLVPVDYTNFLKYVVIILGILGAGIGIVVIYSMMKIAGLVDNELCQEGGLKNGRTRVVR